MDIALFFLTKLKIHNFLEFCVQYTSEKSVFIRDITCKACVEWT